MRTFAFSRPVIAALALVALIASSSPSFVSPVWARGGGATTAAPAYQPNLRIETAADGTKSLWDGAEKLGDIVPLKSGTKLLHWAAEADTQRWDQARRIPPEEVAFLASQHEGQMCGGGFYASLDPFDSMHFGTHATVVEITQDTAMLKADASSLESTELFKNQGGWDAIQKAVRSNGIPVIEYSGNWVNFVGPEPLGQTHAVRDSGELLGMAEKAGRELQVSEVFDLESKFGFPDHEYINKQFPGLRKLVKGEPITATEHTALYKKIQPYLEMGINHSSPTMGKLLKEFRPEVVAGFKEQYQQTKALMKQQLAQPGNEIAANFHLENLMERAINSGIEPAEFVPGVTTRVAAMPANFNAQVRYPQNEYGQKLHETFEFIDLNDILEAMAKGEGEPWKSYDQPGQTPLLDRWRAAKQVPTSDNEAEDIVKIYRALSGNPNGTFRDNPIMAGGDIQVNGNGYYRVTAEQKAVLEKNPYLVVEILPDPASTGNPVTYLGRHQYPSAGTYKKFESMLSPELARKLKAAESAGKLTPDTQEFKSLTQAILKELLTDASKSAKAETYLQKFQRQIAIHPFSDFNGRSLRANYQAQGAMPLFMNNWDLDLFLSYENFAAEALAGQNQYNRIGFALGAAEVANPTFPAYYDIPEPWQIVAEVPELDEPPQDFINRMKAWYRDPANAELVRHKQYYDIEQGVRRQCVKQSLLQRIKPGP